MWFCKELKNNNPETTFIIRRVVIIGGDCVEIKDSKLFINKNEIKEEGLKETNDYIVAMPKGKVFILVDNCSESMDSWTWSCFDFDDDIVGKMIFKVTMF